MSSTLLVVLCAVVATVCALALRRSSLVIAWPAALAGLLVAIAVGAYAALRHDDSERVRRAEAACLGRGGVATIESARGRPDRVYCVHGARRGYTLP